MYIYIYIYIYISTCRFNSLQSLITHIRNDHNVLVNIKTIQFEDFQSFLSWKEEEEFNTISQNVQQCAPKLYVENKVWYYYCNRAGIYKPRGTQVRQLKSQGTSKVGGQCTAHMKAIVNQTSGQVQVKYCATHHSHKTQLTYLRIPPIIRMEIAAKSQQRIDMDRVMDDIRDATIKQMNRQHLITKQDLHSIKAQFNIDGVVKHKNDLLSVSAWVKELREMKYNPVLVFKKQGEEQQEDLDISMKDFLLCFQTEFQRDMLIKFGSSAICMDSTHGTNCYDFNLMSLVVMDEYGEGIDD